MDASLFCLTPLDQWIHTYSKSGLFLFESSTNLTIIANWFIASTAKQKTIKLLRSRLLDFWKKNDFGQINLKKKIIRKLLTPLLNKNKYLARIWLNPFFLRLFKIYPYQIFYFIFYEIISKNKEHRIVWERIPKLNKYICWPYQESNHIPSKELITRIENEFVPMLKLKWKGYNNNDFNELSLINQLQFYQSSQPPSA